MATIRELDSGSWQAIVRRRGIKPAVKMFRTKTDAKRWVRVIESEMGRGVFLDRSEGERTTIGEPSTGICWKSRRGRKICTAGSVAPERA